MLLTTEVVLTPAQQHLAHERRAVLDAAKNQSVSLCAQAKPNIAILPPSAASKTEVAYVMTPQTDLSAWPMGGHYRFELANGRPGPAEPFTKSCISLAPQSGNQGAPAAMVISQILGDTPTEIHVFTMLASKLPVFVIAARTGKVWAVEAKSGQARITLVNQLSKSK